MKTTERLTRQVLTLTSTHAISFSRCVALSLLPPAQGGPNVESPFHKNDACPSLWRSTGEGNAAPHRTNAGDWHYELVSTERALTRLRRYIETPDPIHSGQFIVNVTELLPDFTDVDTASLLGPRVALLYKTHHFFVQFTSSPVQCIAYVCCARAVPQIVHLIALMAPGALWHSGTARHE